MSSRLLLACLPLVAGVSLTTKGGHTYVPFHFTDQTNAAAGLFNNIRVPAAVLSGAALANAFALQNVQDEQFNTKHWKRLRAIYVTLMTITCSTELLTILMATSASTRVLGGGFDPMAESCMAMITREFPSQHVGVQFNFITGMIAFVIAQSIRFYKELSVKPFTTYISRATAWILAATSFQMIAFFNADLITVSGYPELFRQHVGHLLAAAWKGLFNLQPASVLAVACVAIACFYVVLSVLDADQDGSITSNDFAEMFSEFTSGIMSAVRHLQVPGIARPPKPAVNPPYSSPKKTHKE